MSTFRLAVIQHHHETWMSHPNPCCLKNFSHERRTPPVLPLTWLMRILVKQDFANNKGAQFHPLLSMVELLPSFVQVFTFSDASEGTFLLPAHTWKLNWDWCDCDSLHLPFPTIEQWDVFTPDTSIIYIPYLQTSSSLLDLPRVILPLKQDIHSIYSFMLTCHLKHRIKLSLEVNQVLFRDSVQMFLVVS